MEINGQTVTSIELFSQEDYPIYFEPEGCENCDDKKGVFVKDVLLHTEKTGPIDGYEVKLCMVCIDGYTQGILKDTKCKNKFKIGE